MRLTASVLAIVFALAPMPGWAFPNAGSLPAGGANIIDAAVKCGPHAHYVRGHRDKNHHYVKGRCIRDRRK